MEEKKKLPPILHVDYLPGELIIKEGDYGISIYKILKGNVRIFKRSGNTKATLATLGKGEIFGEMTFFNFLLEPRSASVEAIDEVELEVWHPARLIEEYKKMPPMLTYLVKQSLNRLLRMSKVVNELISKKRQKKRAEVAPAVDRRRYYRKKWEQECSYRPVDSLSALDLNGVIKDISPIGLGVEVPLSRRFKFAYIPGSELEVSFQLPSGETVKERALIRWGKESKIPNHLLLGLEFSNLSSYSAKQIRFFVMP